jgi:hypothetical protein
MSLSVGSSFSLPPLSPSLSFSFLPGREAASYLKEGVWGDMGHSKSLFAKRFEKCWQS